MSTSNLTPNPAPDVFQSVVSLIGYELKTNGINPQLNISQYVSQTTDLISEVKTKIGPDLSNATAYLGQNSLISQIVSSCATNLQPIITSGTIGLNDVPNFLSIIKTIYSCINQHNVTTSTTVTITGSELVTLACFILKVILTFTLPDAQALSLAMGIATSTAEIVSFSMNDCSWSFSGFKCCSCAQTS
jgi:hypothetical protein